jgi:hypothetical protein
MAIPRPLWLIIFVVAWLTISAMLSAAFILTTRLMRRLREEHPDDWDRLGRPTLSNASISSGVAAQRFLWRREYLDIDDPELQSTAGHLRALQLAYAFALIGVAGAIIVMKTRS